MTRDAGGGASPLQDVPLGQRLADNWALLLVAGVVIMLVIYTGWGLYEVLTLPAAELP